MKTILTITICLISTLAFGQTDQSMQIIASQKNNLHPDVVWPWPMTALQIITVDNQTSTKVATFIAKGVAGPFTVKSCLIKPSNVSCMPSSGLPECCVLSKNPGEIDLIPGTLPGNYVVYLSAPGSSVK